MEQPEKDVREEKQEEQGNAPKEEEKKKKKKAKVNIRNSSDVSETEAGSYEGVIPIPELLRTTERRVNYAKNVTIRKEVLEKVPGAFVLHGVLTLEECKEYIEISEEMGYEPAPLRVLNGKENDVAQMDKTIRNAYRVLWHAPEDVVNVINERVLPFMPEEVVIEYRHLPATRWAIHPQCINERWRFGRYTIGQYFRPHFDAGFTRNRDEMSHMTFIIYLNGGFEGGETTFFPEGKPDIWAQPNTVEEYKVVPEPGMALVFYHSGVLSPRHEGAELTKEGDAKYIIRSDVMFKRIETEEKDEKNKKNKKEKEGSSCLMS